MISGTSTAAIRLNGISGEMCGIASQFLCDNGSCCGCGVY